MLKTVRRTGIALAVLGGAALTGAPAYADVNVQPQVAPMVAPHVAPIVAPNAAPLVAPQVEPHVAG